MKDGVDLRTVQERMGYKTIQMIFAIRPPWDPSIPWQQYNDYAILIKL
jgi:hypothetical protein